MSNKSNMTTITNDKMALKQSSLSLTNSTTKYSLAKYCNNNSLNQSCHIMSIALFTTQVSHNYITCQKVDSRKEPKNMHVYTSNTDSRLFLCQNSGSILLSCEATDWLGKNNRTVQILASFYCPQQLKCYFSLATTQRRFSLYSHHIHKINKP